MFEVAGRVGYLVAHLYAWYSIIERRRRNELMPLVPGIPLPINAGPPRADLLIFVENKGKASQQAPRVTRGLPAAGDYLRGR